MILVVIPAFGKRISPRMDFAKNIHLIKTDNQKVIERNTIQILTRNRLHRIHKIMSLKPDVIICDGLTEMCKHEFEKANITVIPWVQGNIEDVLQSFLQGKLKTKIEEN